VDALNSRKGVDGTVVLTRELLRCAEEIARRMVGSDSAGSRGMVGSTSVRAVSTTGTAAGAAQVGRYRPSVRRGPDGGTP
jgi:hypothetical protein